MTIEKSVFGEHNSTPVHLFYLENDNGLNCEITNFGGIVVSINVPDRNGDFDDIALGFKTLDEYKEGSPYFGALVGRYGNRIANGSFSLNGVDYQLAQNDETNHLHGGNIGFDKVIWEFEVLETDVGPSLVLSYLSKDGEENFPGNLSVKATYTLTHKNELCLDYEVSTDKDTIQNLTHHSYFNLHGEGMGTILDHEVIIHADAITPVTELLIPTGDFMPVEGTPFDFRTAKQIGENINDDHVQLNVGGGYDHNFVLNKEPDCCAHAARVTESKSGRILDCYTTEPGVQFYVGNFLDNTLKGKKGNLYPQRSGFCLEPQHFPDSPNQIHFPSTVLKANDTYNSTIKYTFSVMD